MNSKHIAYCLAAGMLASTVQAELVNSFSYAGAGAKNPCKAVVGADAVVCDAKKEPVQGSGIVTNSEDTVWVPKGYSLRIAHGGAGDTNSANWCLSMKVRTPDDCEGGWFSFYSLGDMADGALFLRNDRNIGCKRWGGYSPVTWTEGKWHALTVCVSISSGIRSVFLDGKLVKASKDVKGLKPSDFTYLYIAGDDDGDDDGEDGDIGIGDVRIWDEAYPKELFPGKTPEEMYSRLLAMAPQKQVAASEADIKNKWKAIQEDPLLPRFEFDGNGEFVFLHVTDIQESQKLHKVSEMVLTEAVRRFHPKLAVVTGDNVGNPVNAVKTFDAIVDAFRKNELPFCVTFGNHDTGRGHERQGQYDMLKQAGGRFFVDHDVPELTGGGNGFIDLCLKGSDKPAFRLYVMDSCAYGVNVAGKVSYDGCHADQIAWFEKVVGKTPYLWFQHIVVPEINTTGILVDGQLAPGVAGEKKESPCPPFWETYTNAEHTVEGRTLYDSWRKSGCHRGSYFGHDHKNTFDGTDKNGIRMGYTKALTLCSYNDGNPGLRVFKLKADGTFETFIFTARDTDPE